MACSHDEFGHRNCQIVPHPDRPYESFCINCSQRFQNMQPSVDRFKVENVIAALILSVLIWSLIPKTMSETTANPVQEQQLR